jgi:hypothetical protein
MLINDAMRAATPRVLRRVAMTYQTTLGVGQQDVLRLVPADHPDPLHGRLRPVVGPLPRLVPPGGPSARARPHRGRHTRDGTAQGATRKPGRVRRGCRDPRVERCAAGPRAERRRLAAWRPVHAVHAAQLRHPAVSRVHVGAQRVQPGRGGSPGGGHGNALLPRWARHVRGAGGRARARRGGPGRHTTTRPIRRGSPDGSAASIPCTTTTPRGSPGPGSAARRGRRPAGSTGMGRVSP